MTLRKAWYPEGMTPLASTLYPEGVTPLVLYPRIEGFPYSLRHPGDNNGDGEEVKKPDE
ncbi:unnamed protein product [Ectocarpus sp. CCAP 1310/34]|nr:unnamed protein product [Ectocarpus sp. CCAP 1310/34]